MMEKNNKIFEYIESQYNTQIDLLKSIDAKIANILVIIGLLLAADGYLAETFYSLKGNPWIIFFLLSFTIGTFYLVKAILCSIKLLSLTHYNIPSLEPDVQRALKDLQDINDIDENQLMKDLTKNYLEAFNNNQVIMENRNVAYSALINNIRKGIILLLISFIGAFIINWQISSPTIKSKEGIFMTKNNEAKNQKGKSEEDKSKKPQQPSAQGKPTIITAGEERADIKTVDFEEGTVKGK